eukprot:4670652-Amphidinium_carterae.3
MTKTIASIHAATKELQDLHMEQNAVAQYDEYPALDETVGEEETSYTEQMALNTGSDPLQRSNTAASLQEGATTEASLRMRLHDTFNSAWAALQTRTHRSTAAKAGYIDSQAEARSIRMAVNTSEVETYPTDTIFTEGDRITVPNPKRRGRPKAQGKGKAAAPRGSRPSVPMAQQDSATSQQRDSQTPRQQQNQDSSLQTQTPLQQQNSPPPRQQQPYVSPPPTQDYEQQQQDRDQDHEEAGQPHMQQQNHPSPPATLDYEPADEGRNNPPALLHRLGLGTANVELENDGRHTEVRAGVTLIDDDDSDEAPNL